MKNPINSAATLLFVIAALVLSGCASDPATDPALIDAALAADNRTDAERGRDARSKPAVILGLLDLQPGDHAADILGGGGYYAVLIANVVGDDGEVTLQNNTPYLKFVEKRNAERYGGGAYPNIELVSSEVDDLKLGENHLDAALMVMSYHDLYFVAPDRGWYETDIDLFWSQVHAALKPGGVLVIVDHSAIDGTGDGAVAEIHRIDEAFVRQEVERNGFRFVASSDALRNPDDERTKMVFDKSIRGKTDRFVLKFLRE